MRRAPSRALSSRPRCVDSETPTRAARSSAGVAPSAPLTDAFSTCAPAKSALVRSALPSAGSLWWAGGGPDVRHDPVAGGKRHSKYPAWYPAHSLRPTVDRGRDCTRRSPRGEAQRQAWAARQEVALAAGSASAWDRRLGRVTYQGHRTVVERWTPQAYEPLSDVGAVLGPGPARLLQHAEARLLRAGVRPAHLALGAMDLDGELAFAVPPSAPAAVTRAYVAVGRLLRRRCRVCGRACALSHAPARAAVHGAAYALETRGAAAPAATRRAKRSARCGANHHDLSRPVRIRGDLSSAAPPPALCAWHRALAAQPNLDTCLADAWQLTRVPHGPLRLWLVGAALSPEGVRAALTAYAAVPFAGGPAPVPVALVAHALDWITPDVACGLGPGDLVPLLNSPHEMIRVAAMRVLALVGP